ncbi:MAG: DUF2165 domain-containing protein [Rhodospirillales bacterium]|nr:DUF2165 domain-containing protein [Rhodospirillales bacterium]
MAVRLCKIALLACYTLLLTLIAFGNITDYDSNWPFVQHVLAMDTTFQSPGVIWRAITDPTIQTIAYLGIIATETAAGLICWAGIVQLVRHRRASPARFLLAGGITLLFLIQPERETGA